MAAISGALSTDVCVVGGGIVGVAVARALAIRLPKLQVTVLEQEPELAMHQTGRNSGVVHSGVYYRPGSLKAKLCTRGNQLIADLCQDRGLPYLRCGKVIVALDTEQEKRLRNIFSNGQENGVPGIQWLDSSGLKEKEPHCNGVAAVFCPSTAICDYGQVTQALASDVKALGGDIRCNHAVTGIDTSDSDVIRVHTQHGATITCKKLVSCAGLHADRLAAMSGANRNPRIVPFRGEYLQLKEEKRHLVRGNIYPVPDPRFPFLGVHFTPRIDGSLWLGPNAVPAFSRHGYTYSDIDLADIWDYIRYPGFLKLAAQYAGFGISELYRSIFVSAQVKQLQKYVPDIQPEDVEPAPSGVRAQALGQDGNLVEDFLLDNGGSAGRGRMLHLRNAPSPAATSSLAIADMIIDEAMSAFGLDTS